MWRRNKSHKKEDATALFPGSVDEVLRPKGVVNNYFAIKN